MQKRLSLGFLAMRQKEITSFVYFTQMEGHGYTYI